MYIHKYAHTYIWYVRIFYKKKKKNKINIKKNNYYKIKTKSTTISYY